MPSSVVPPSLGRRRIIRIAEAAGAAIAFLAAAGGRNAPTIASAQQAAAAAFNFTYTSPATADAVRASGCDDVCLLAGREAARAGLCSSPPPLPECHMLFAPRDGDLAGDGNGGTRRSMTTATTTTTKPAAGVVFYGGALVDPRSYAPLAATLADRYGLAVAIPIFEDDLALDCGGHRASLAVAALPSVGVWVLAGHSMGGSMAARVLHSSLAEKPSVNVNDNGTTEALGEGSDGAPVYGGLAVLGSSMSSPLCNITAVDLDFSHRRGLPTALVVGALDGLINSTMVDAAAARLPDDAFVMNITGGNHAQFGSYDSSDRVANLGRGGMDGNATIPPLVQQDLAAAAIAHVASIAVGGDLGATTSKNPNSTGNDNGASVASGGPWSCGNVGSRVSLVWIIAATLILC